MPIDIPRGRSESSPTLQLIVMMLLVLAQLFSFTRFPFMPGKVSATRGIRRGDRDQAADGRRLNELNCRRHGERPDHDDGETRMSRRSS